MRLTDKLSTTFTISVDNRNEPTEITLENVNMAFDNILSLFDLLEDESVTDFEKAITGFDMLIGVDERNDLLKLVDDGILEARTFWQIFTGLINEIFEEDDENDGYFDLAGNPMPKPEHKKTFDVVQDAPFIYASFIQDYGIDLFEQQGKLDYRKFKALLNSLSDKTYLSTIINIRTMDVPKGKEGSKVREAKAMFRLRE